MSDFFDSRSFSPRRLVETDVMAACRLSTDTGWNQTESDWRIMIEIGRGIGLVDSNDRLIGTSILLPFLPQVDWICMVLVDTQ